MVEQYEADKNPNLIDVYLQALLQRESTGNYQAKHASSIITDFATKKPIKVQALGGYGILDVNFPVWAKQAGLQDFSMSDGDWKDPKVQDAIAKYKVQEYFNRFQSWDSVSIAWFAGDSKAQEFIDNGVIDFEKEDVNGVSIKAYVDSMNKLITDEMMNIEIEPEVFDTAYRGEPRGPMQRLPQIGESKSTFFPMNPMQDSNSKLAAQILDALTKANSGGVRPNLFSGDFSSQVPPTAQGFEEARYNTRISRLRNNIGK
tara:strand:+ start:471 stop:1247 length:777 start_codon:yes stop_codon:yes gene_type:complete